MTRSQFFWCLKLLGYWLLTYVAIETAAPIRHLLWWMLRSGGSIHEPLGLFNTRTYLPFQIAWGCFLGLFPLHRVIDLFWVLFGRFRQTSAPEVDEWNWRRPILWAWVPFTAIFLLRFLFFQGHSESVFGGGLGITRWQYFFSNYMLEWPSSEYPLTLAWMIDRLAITGPMLLTLAYTVTVHVRLRAQEKVSLSKTTSDPPAIVGPVKICFADRLELLPDLIQGDRPFVLFLAMDATTLQQDEIVNIAAKLVRHQLAYLVAWGPDCERVHDGFDRAIVDSGIESDDPEIVVSTTWHSRESIEEALWFFENCAIPSEGFHAPQWIAVSIGNPDWLAIIKEFLSHHVSIEDAELIHRLH